MTAHLNNFPIASGSDYTADSNSCFINKGDVLKITAGYGTTKYTTVVFVPYK